jgi:hypothetical protein
MKIYAQYNTDGAIDGLQHVEGDELPNKLTSPYVEITMDQKLAFQANSKTHGVIDGVFSSAWFKPIDLAVTEAARIRNIKSKTNAAILIIMPEYKQRNYLAKSVELTRIELRGDTLTSEEYDQVAAIELLWSTVEAMRAKSNIAEAEGTLADDFNPNI